MSDEATGLIVVVLLLVLGAGGVVATLITTAQRNGARESLKELKAQAVQRGYAEWATDEYGESEWKWVEPETGGKD